MTALNFISPQERQTIASAIAAAEKTTSAEIVCAVATASGRYDREESIVGLLGSLLALAGINLVAAGGPEAAGTWTTIPHVTWVAQALAVVIGFIVGSFAAGRWPALRRLLSSSETLAGECTRAAMMLFCQRRLASTRSRSGLLIFVSLAERRVVVLGDDRVMAAAGQALLDKVRDLAVTRLRSGRHPETFLDAIDVVTTELASKLPPEPVDPNELSNELLCLHPRP
jgi:putative membrane protein